MSAAQTTMFLLGTVGPSLLVSWVLCGVVRRLAASWGLVDAPSEQHKTHQQSTPLGGGLAIFAALVVPLLLGQLIISADLLSVPDFVATHLGGLKQQSGQLWIFVAAGGSLMLLGLADDRFGVHWGVRLGLQFVIATAYVVLSGVRLTAFIPGAEIQILMTVVWIVALVNAFNMLDNMNGLSAGVAAICSASLAAMLLIAPDPETGGPQLFVAGLALVLAGSLMGFLPHNFPGAKLFMGDAGSYFVGFMLAVLTMLGTYASYDSASRHAVLAPLFLLAVPLYDMVSVLMIRLRSGRSPFQADQNHFSHRLVAHGFSRTVAVLVIYLMTAVSGLAAMVLHEVSSIGAIAIALLMVCLLGLVALLESRPRQEK